MATPPQQLNAHSFTAVYAVMGLGRYLTGLGRVDGHITRPVKG